MKKNSNSRFTAFLIMGVLLYLASPYIAFFIVKNSNGETQIIDGRSMTQEKIGKKQKDTGLIENPFLTGAIWFKDSSKNWDIQKLNYYFSEGSDNQVVLVISEPYNMEKPIFSIPDEMINAIKGSIVFKSTFFKSNNKKEVIFYLDNLKWKPIAVAYDVLDKIALNFNAFSTKIYH